MTTTTPAWFFAAARSMLGPPMSIFSIASSTGQSGFAIVLRKRIEIDHHHVDGIDAGVAELGHLRRRIAPSENPGVKARMQGFHAPIEHFGKARCRSATSVTSRPSAAQLPGRAAGRQDADPELRQPTRKLGEAGLVGYADQRGADLCHARFVAQESLEEFAPEAEPALAATLTLLS